MREYAQYDAVGLAELVRRGEVSASELVDEAIARTERVNPRLGAVVHRMYDRARDAARAPGDGPLAGVPMLIKDLLQTIEGEPTTEGSWFTRDWIADHDTELVRRYRSAGAIFFGKTNAPEFGLVPVTEPARHGPARNPWNPERTPGGSSGGAAAAVAAGIVPAAHGGDGGGSIRIPSACCGVFGLKPTRGRNPVGPDASEHWNGFVQEHVLTRSVRDSAVLLDATAGPEPTSPYHAPPQNGVFAGEVEREPGRLRIAFHADPAMPASVDPDCETAVRDAAALCEELGHDVAWVSPGHEPETLARHFFTVVCAQIAAEIEDLERRVGRRATPRWFETETWLVAMFGRQLRAADLAVALRYLQGETRRLVRRYADWDVVLTPTLGRPPVPHGTMRAPAPEQALLRAIALGRLGPALRLPGVLQHAVDRAYRIASYTPVANFTGQPSMSVPLWWNADGLPVGSMFTGRFGDEATLLRLAAQLERARPWAHRRPPIHADGPD